VKTVVWLVGDLIKVPAITTSISQQTSIQFS